MKLFNIKSIGQPRQGKPMERDVRRFKEKTARVMQLKPRDIRLAKQRPINAANLNSQAILQLGSRNLTRDEPVASLGIKGKQQASNEQQPAANRPQNDAEPGH
jgi:hypothetical protein